MKPTKRKPTKGSSRKATPLEPSRPIAREDVYKGIQADFERGMISDDVTVQYRPNGQYTFTSSIPPAVELHEELKKTQTFAPLLVHHFVRLLGLLEGPDPVKMVYANIMMQLDKIYLTLQQRPDIVAEARLRNRRFKPGLSP